MTPQNRKELALNREAEAWRLRCQGRLQREIADQLGITQQRVCQLLKRANERVLKELTEDVARVKAEELAQLDWVLSESGKAWEREQNPQFLAQFRGALADKRSLLGLDAPAKIAPTTPDGAPLFPGLSEALKKVYGGDGHGDGPDSGGEPGTLALPGGGA